GCEDDLANALASLGASLDPLRAAVNSGSIPAINAAMANTNNALQQVCAALGLSCPAPTGAWQDYPAPAGGAPDSPGDCCRDCGNSCFANCYYQGQAAIAAHDTCVSHINEFDFCRKEMPFCDWRAAPFQPSLWDMCKSTSYYRQYLLLAGGRDCRCTV